MAPGHIRGERLGVRLIPYPGFIAKNQTEFKKPIEIFIGPLTSRLLVRTNCGARSDH